MTVRPTTRTSTSDDGVDATRVARDATVHSFLNCYCLETGAGEFVPAAETPIDRRPESGLVLRCSLPNQGIDLFVPVRYRSPTGRHLFDLPAAFRAGDGEPQPLDYATLATLATKELELARGADPNRDDLLERVVRSCRNVERYVEARADDGDALYGTDFTFREAEQSLVFGHLQHPTPKSRRGMGNDAERYAPELEGSFRLHYVRADADIVESESAREGSAAGWVREALRADPAVDESVLEGYLGADDVLLPVHPWQAERLLERPDVQDLVAAGKLESIGPLGREFYPTTSVRTLYAPDSPFMVKGSLAVEITNSLRTNKRPELERGVAISTLLATELGDNLRDRFPDFDVIRDPAYLTVDPDALATDGDESGFEVVLRENPFRGEDARQATPVVALCQDAIGDGRSRLGRIIASIAEREGRDPAAVSEEWFRRYLAISVRPLLWLYLERGIGLEAHQQNSVLTLDEAGYPDEFRYRDNQGYYFPESAYDRLEAVCPGIGERANSICPDAVADERIRYYVVLNNALGVINAFGTAGLVAEERLLAILRKELESLREFDRPGTSILDPLLESETVPRKANLLTRFRGLDELDAPSLDEQSVYAEVRNPLVDAGDAAGTSTGQSSGPEVNR
ncbi:IucA/IucC family protein [Natrinema pellirubrum DSM 15624]|uniref:IucA/IucC family protein n=1 Tax=Natrinema pellirubrum (strain DSM 15624 / CIP 106293 / JCM 10476 / NCIMB 786 / 157) TaxID=797303 RepID=L0JQK4_NATP1|nr:IucA/IucC family protein [Natrinema pellirubrum]AGB33524.1 siderophore synthetase component [Natrinema pellirubrum DSM 15624]ELY70687.1 IucA/IucC family protein [Natrinema pellirubrum DSM 15624]